MIWPGDGLLKGGLEHFVFISYYIGLLGLRAIRGCGQAVGRVPRAQGGLGDESIATRQVEAGQGGAGRIPQPERGAEAPALRVQTQPQLPMGNVPRP